MARIAGVDLPRDKRIEIGLTYVFGIGRTSAKRILEETGINPDTRVRDLSDEEEARIRECIDKEFIVEGDLRRQVALNIKNLTEIGSYRGLRQRREQPRDGSLQAVRFQGYGHRRPDHEARPCQRPWPLRAYPEENQPHHRCCGGKGGLIYGTES